MAGLQADQGGEGSVAEQLCVDDLGCDDGLFLTGFTRVSARVEIRSIKCIPPSAFDIALLTISRFCSLFRELYAHILDLCSLNSVFADILHSGLLGSSSHVCVPDYH
jgi:hypothetical protein